MANNLFVSYDLVRPDKNYEAVITAIKAVSGVWARVHYSLWYVKSDLTAGEVAQRIRPAMDGNDKLLVVDCNNNTAAWYTLEKEVEEYMRSRWHN